MELSRWYRGFLGARRSSTLHSQKRWNGNGGKFGSRVDFRLARFILQKARTAKVVVLFAFPREEFLTTKAIFESQTYAGFYVFKPPTPIELVSPYQYVY